MLSTIRGVTCHIRKNDSDVVGIEVGHTWASDAEQFVRQLFFELHDKSKFESCLTFEGSDQIVFSATIFSTKRSAFFQIDAVDSWKLLDLLTNPNNQLRFAWFDLFAYFSYQVTNTYKCSKTQLSLI